MMKTMIMTTRLMRVMMRAMMRAMMAECFGGMEADKMQEMCATMMGLMAGKGPGGAEGKMAQMPEMMLTRMMPHCIGMMLPAIEPERRGEVAGAILTAVVEAGAGGLTETQAMAFHQALADVLNP